MKTIQSLAEIILNDSQLATDMLQVEIVMQKILSFRQVLIQQDYQRYSRINEQLVQAFDVELTEVAEDDDRFYVSDYLPKPIILGRGCSPFISVHTAYKGKTKQPLHYLSVEEVPYMKYRKFTNKGEYFTYENNRLIVYTEVPSARIRAIWDSPIDALNFAKRETFKLACSDKTISSPCTEGDDLLLEETMAARILTFFNPRNVSTRQEPAEYPSN